MNIKITRILSNIVKFVSIKNLVKCIKKSIIKKYLVAFIAMIVFPTIIIGIFGYTAYTNVILQESSQKTLQTLNQTSVGIDNQTRSLSIALSALALDRGIMDLLTEQNISKDNGHKYELSKQIDEKLNNVLSYVNGVYSITFYFKGGGYYYFGNMPLVSEKEVRENDWYRATLENNHNIFFIDSLNSMANKYYNKHFFSAAISPNIPEFKSDVELIYISMSTNILDSFYSSRDDMKSGDLVLIGRNNKIVMSKDEKAIGKDFNDIYNISSNTYSKPGSFSVNIGGQKTILTTCSAEKSNWRLVKFTSPKELTGNFNVITRNIIIASIAIIILFTIFIFLFFYGIVIPIAKITKEMRKIEKGNFETSIQTKGNDEIYRLGSTFNKMVCEIKQLMTERDFKERERSRAEIEALQAQINPHFISNTLSSIRFMAMVAKVDSIKDMTEAFIKIVSASFNRGGKFTTIEKEIETLKSYVYIMKVRHGNKYDVNFEENEVVKGHYLLKMVIQPILENAMLHGVNDMERKGLISVRFNMIEKYIVVEVEDNGIGMKQEQIEKLLNDDCGDGKGFTGLGIRNVDKRIKLNYGDGYGVRIESKYEEFTKIKVYLPILNNEDLL